MTDLQTVLPNLKHQNSGNFFLISGPCVVESRDQVFRIAEHLIQLSDNFRIPFIFKASFEKANRSRIDSFSSIGMLEALQIVKEVSSTFNIPVTTDIHTEDQASIAAEYVDILQIPAFLCRQTSLLVASAKTGKVVNIKKGQFMSPEAMSYSVDKVRSSSNPNVWLTDRGTCFGYHDLIVDFRGVKALQKTGCPTILDCTHSLQQPNQESGITGGRPDLIETIAKAGIAVGYDGLFIETHYDPSSAKSDGANMLPLNEMERLLSKLVKIRSAIIE